MRFSKRLLTCRSWERPKIDIGVSVDTAGKESGRNIATVNHIEGLSLPYLNSSLSGNHKQFMLVGGGIGRSGIRKQDPDIFQSQKSTASRFLRYRMYPLQYPLGSQSLVPNLFLFTFGYIFVGILFTNLQIPDINVLK